MQRRISWILSSRGGFALVALLGAGLKAEGQAMPQAITVLADNWCPYNCDPNSEKRGFLIEMLEEALKKKNIKVNYRLIPWNKAIAEVRAGRADAIVGGSPEEAPDFVFPGIPMAKSQICFYTSGQSSWTFAGSKSLYQAHLGLIKSYSYGYEVDGYVQDPKHGPITWFVGDNAFLSITQALQARKIEVTAENRNVVQWLVSLNPKSLDFLRNVGCAKTEQLYVAFSPHASKKAVSRALADYLTSALSIQKEMGVTAKITARYGMEEAP